MNLTKPDYSNISKGGLISLYDKQYDFIVQELKSCTIRSMYMGLKIENNTNNEGILYCLRMGLDYQHQTGMNKKLSI